jgi:8-oxo-dGTP pyrophosphatase MutT (NUDIX family)
VLLTRRSKNLFSFPKAWVFPGGKLDENENFVCALKREILEETGINIDELQKENLIKIRPILLYESSFPQQMPSSQILVIFFVVEINKPKEELKLKIEVNEVDAYAWVDLDLLKVILFTGEERIHFEFEGSCYDPVERKFIEATFNQHNFHIRETGEYIPYGHYLACKYI